MVLQDVKTEVNLGAAQKTFPMDPSSIYGQAILQSKSGINAGIILWSTEIYCQFARTIGSMMILCILEQKYLL